MHVYLHWYVSLICVCILTWVCIPNLLRSSLNTCLTFLCSVGVIPRDNVNREESVEESPDKQKKEDDNDDLEEGDSKYVTARLESLHHPTSHVN